MQFRKIILSLAVLAFVLALTVAATQPVQGQTFAVVYTFMGGADGSSPGGLDMDANGNLYGAAGGGGDLSCNGTIGCGVIFRIDATGAETVLHTFGLGTDGKFPSSVARDATGNLYGTTSEGGTFDHGTVFRLDTTDTETVLWSFNGQGDGSQPFTGVIWDAARNLYGTTPIGGTYGNGTAYKLDTTGKEIVLHSFTGGVDGDTPVAALILNAGNLYGTTSGGGYGNGGTVFRLDSRGRGTALYQFKGTANGDAPEAALIRDEVGNLYSTTLGGGAYNLGTVFRLDRTGTVTVLHSFAGGATDGASPEAGLVRDTAGNLYGTTYYGGGGPCQLYGSGCGTVFKLDTSGLLTLLYSFTGGTDGAFPNAGLLRDEAGNLYGTASTGGTGGSGPCNNFGQSGCGTVFKITP